MEIGLSLGSNLDDRLDHLRQAKAGIAALRSVTLLAASPVYETEPVDVLPQYAEMPFLNAVLIIDAEPEIDRLLASLHEIETGLGRKRHSDRNSPRQIDIDIIYAGELVILLKDGGVPHPRWSTRRFVVKPLSDLRPDLRIPGAQRTVREVLLALPPAPKVVLFTDRW